MHGIEGKLFFGNTGDQTPKEIENSKNPIERLTALIDKHSVPKQMFRLTPHKEEDSVFVELKSSLYIKCLIAFIYAKPMPLIAVWCFFAFQ